MQSIRRLISTLGFLSFSGLFLAVTLLCTVESPAAAQTEAPEAAQTTSFSVPLSEGALYIPPTAAPDLINEGTETTTADIGEVLASYLCADGTEVLFYRALTGGKYCAYIPAGTERLLRFTAEENVYSEGYAIEPFENVLGYSGFRICCPRGAAYYAYDYYYFDEAGQLQLLADCASMALEVDLNGDGQKELLWCYHGYELYFYYRLDGVLYLTDLGALVTDALDIPRTVAGFTVPETAEAFADGKTAFSLLQYGEGGGYAELFRGEIRLTADTLEVNPQQAA